MAVISEKGGLPTTSTPQSPPSKRASYKKHAALLLAASSLCLLHFRSSIPGFTHSEPHPQAVVLADACKQVDPISPQKSSEALDQIFSTISSPSYKNKSIEFLSNAVKIPTISYDTMSDPGVDPRWEVFYKFPAFLEDSFPLVHQSLKAEKINTHGLLYTWQGSNPSLKPSLLMGHYDVVPVPEATVPTWTHPPFSGFFDGKNIWGRGSSDDKNQVLAIFEAVELLLSASFVPTRTHILAFGFDEESAGYRGAGSLATFLTERYGKNSIASIVDEGSGIGEIWGKTVASPGVAEKGSLNVDITIRMPGGHSSVPPPHTSIGVLAELITLIEAETYPTFLDAKNPYYSQLVCGANYAPDFPKPLKKLLASDKKRDGACKKRDVLAEEAAKESLFAKYLMTTSIAVDIVGGGEKSNALPEEASVTVNHRVNIGDTVDHVKAKTEKLASIIAAKHNLTLNAYTDVSPFQNSLTISAPHWLDVAPVSPTSVDGTTPYGILAGTTRAMYGEDMIVAPGLMTGNTDTRFYWNLTEHIFRFAPGYGGPGEGKSGVGKIHTVDESVSVDTHFAAVKWFVLFIRNIDEASFE